MALLEQEVLLHVDIEVSKAHARPSLCSSTCCKGSAMLPTIMG